MQDHLGGQEFIAGVGRATHCQMYTNHHPMPLRYVWHHILPQACGGKSNAGNLVSVCDSCHYAIHALLYDLRKGNGKFLIFNRFRNTSRGMTAYSGYASAVALGTQDKIPSEGSIG